MKTIYRLLGLVLIGLAVSNPVHAAIRPREVRGDGNLKLLNLHLKEEAQIRYLNPNGSVIKQGVDQAMRLLRCRMTSQTHIIPLKLLELVDHLQDHFGAAEVQVVSGYRSPSLNENLRKSGHKVAKMSRHMRGEAMDIRIPGVPTKTLRDYAASLKVGGVGFYPEDGFVHVDIGPVRYW